MKTFLTILASTGGIWKMLTAIISLLLTPFQEFTFYSKIMNKVFFEEKNNNNNNNNNNNDENEK